MLEIIQYLTEIFAKHTWLRIAERFNLVRSTDANDVDPSPRLRQPKIQSIAHLMVNVINIPACQPVQDVSKESSTIQRHKTNNVLNDKGLRPSMLDIPYGLLNR